jgi:hypothetical protein
MTDPADTIAHSPVDYSSAVGYALHVEMRRLLLTYVTGALLLPIGVDLLSGGRLAAGAPLLGWILGLLVTVVGATLLFAGLVGAAFKLVTDANRLASTTLD